MSNKNMKTRMLTAMAMLTAISVILVYLVRFPIFPTAPFLEYDPADIPIYIGTFAFGPLAGLLLTVVVSFIQGATVSSASGIIGIMMHIFSTGSFAVLAGSIYKHNKSRKGAIIALVSGVILMTIMMALWNVVMTPIFMGVPREAVIAMLVPIIIPFNLLKGGINAIITFLIYKMVSKYLHHR